MPNFEERIAQERKDFAEKADKEYKPFFEGLVPIVDDKPKPDWMKISLEGLAHDAGFENLPYRAVICKLMRMNVLAELEEGTYALLFKDKLTGLKLGSSYLSFQDRDEAVRYLHETSLPAKLIKIEDYQKY